MRIKNNRLIFLAAFFASFDLVLKIWILSSDHSYYANRGITFSLFWDHPLLDLFSFAFGLLSTVLILRFVNNYGLSFWASGLYLGGVVSNVMDRLFHGFVIDYLDWRLIFPFWPAAWPRFFNLADVFIVLGLLLLVLEYFGERFRITLDRRQTGEAGRNGH